MRGGGPLLAYTPEWDNHLTFFLSQSNELLYCWASGENCYRTVGGRQEEEGEQLLFFWRANLIKTKPLLMGSYGFWNSVQEVLHRYRFQYWRAYMGKVSSLSCNGRIRSKGAKNSIGRKRSCILRICRKDRQRANSSYLSWSVESGRERFPTFVIGLSGRALFSFNCFNRNRSSLYEFLPSINLISLLSLVRVYSIS